MALIQASSAALQKTIDALDGQVKALQGITAGRKPSNNEARTLKTLRDEREATKELYDQACKAEDEQSRHARKGIFTMDRLQQIEARLTDIRGQLKDPTADLEALEAEVDTLTTERDQIEGRRRTITALGADPDARPIPIARTFPRPGGRGSSDSVFGARDTDPARRVIAEAHTRGLLPGAAAAVAESLVTTGDDASRDLASRWARATGSSHYFNAFVKRMADPETGHMLWTPEEREAYQTADAVKREFRALGSGGGSGGALLPLFLDPAILLTSEGSNNPLRQIARMVQTTSNTWQGVTSAGVTAEWKTEAAEAADASPTLKEAAIPVYFGDAFVPYSYEIEQDGLTFAQELAKLLIDAADQLQAAAFTTGNGSGQPTGFVTALAGTASEVAQAAGEAFTAPDVYAVQSALPARFQPNARWMAGLPTINAIAQFETTNGARLFPEVGEGQLLRRPLHECSNMGDTDDIDAAEAADNYILCYGDWSNFIIADRIGSTIEIIPNLVGANRRPTGQRGAFLWFRTGSDVAVAEAFRLLNVATLIS